MCLQPGGDPWNGGICATCLPPLKPYKARRRVRCEIIVYTVKGVKDAQEAMAKSHDVLNVRRQAADDRHDVQ
jgi:hypothetical protein